MPGVSKRPSAECRRSNRRRQYVINPRFQWNYAAAIGLFVLGSSCMLGSLLYLLLFDQARARVINPTASTGEVLGSVLVVSVLFTLLTVGGVIAWSIIASHRICGPLYVLEGGLRELAQGRLPKPRALRTKDEFKELYQVFVDAVRSLESSRRSELTIIEEALRSARMPHDADSSKVLRSIQAQLQQLQDSALQALGEEVHKEPEDSKSKPRPNPRETVETA